MSPEQKVTAALRKVDSPLKWHGGKSYLASRIVELMPPHIHYVEPFAGGLAVLLARSGEGVSEVVNDLNRDLFIFWSVLQSPEMFEDFRRTIEATPFSKDEFDIAGMPGVTAASRAVDFFIRIRQSRQGLGKDFATLSRNRVRRGMNEQVSAWLSAVEGLPEVHARLKRVVILNDDALNVIRQQDGPNTLFYLDPPYLHETRSSVGAYRHEMTVEQHTALLNHLEEIEGKFMLSGYRSDLYDGVAAVNNWRRVDFDLPNNASGKKTKERKTECVWMNY